MIHQQTFIMTLQNMITHISKIHIFTLHPTQSVGEFYRLKKSCKENPKDFELIQELLTLQKNKSLLNKKRGLKDDIEKRIEQYIKNEK